MANIKFDRWLKAANGNPCVRCGTNAETVCARHYEGIRQHQYGKGKGIKGHDIIVADLCSQCDEIMSNQKDHKSIEKSEEFLHLCMLTIVRRYQTDKWF